jgi:hypothetical protein
MRYVRVGIFWSAVEDTLTFVTYPSYMTSGGEIIDDLIRDFYEEGNGTRRTIVDPKMQQKLEWCSW